MKKKTTLPQKELGKHKIPPRTTVEVNDRFFWSVLSPGIIVRGINRCKDLDESDILRNEMIARASTRLLESACGL